MFPRAPLPILAVKSDRMRHGADLRQRRSALRLLAPHQAAGLGWILHRHGSSLLLSPKGAT
jgi:hypothetical protein